MPTCGICISERAHVLKCPKCDYISCTNCLKEYFKTQTQPVCPNTDCRLQLTREIIAKEASTLLNVYKKMREAYLFDIEKARLPESQDIFRVMKIHKKFREESAPEIMKRINELQSELVDLQNIVDTNLNVIGLFLEKQYDAAMMYHANFIVHKGDDKESVKRVVKEETLCRCPRETCRGFITKMSGSRTGKCGVCDKTMCSTCMTEVNEEVKHTCNEDDIATAREIRKTSKPCPKCAAPIFKIDGCDQMWCVVCHTAFSWKTGEIVTGAIHNPHFFAYQRSIVDSGQDIPRVEGDEPAQCDGENFANLADNYWVSSWIYDQRRRHNQQRLDHAYDYIAAYIRLSLHFSDLMLPAIRRRSPPNNTDLRIGFMNNEITEKEFARVVQQRDKKYQKELEIDAIHLILFDSGNRIVNNSYNSRRINNDYDPSQDFEKIENLVKMANERLVEIGEVYKNKVKKLVFDIDVRSKICTLSFK